MFPAVFQHYHGDIRFENALFSGNCVLVLSLDTDAVILVLIEVCVVVQCDHGHKKRCFLKSMQLDTTVLFVGFALTVVSAVLLPVMKKKRTAICVIEHSPASVQGSIFLESRGEQTLASCHLTGLTPGLHGLHVHRCGDLSDGCASTCDHYNPHNSVHGGPTGKNRHRGDFGNILADDKGLCKDSVLADVSLHEIVGRAFVIHADEDDLGHGGDEESLKTGNAGKRIACGIIR